MAKTIVYSDFIQMLRGAIAEIKENHELLGKLDSFGGDGDHGTTMVRAMGQMEKAIEAADGTDLKKLLKDVGWAIMGVDGGATGPLFGTLFSKMSNGIEGQDSVDCKLLNGLFEQGLAGVRTRTKAQLGDKTMLDALIPAVEAMSAADTDDVGDLLVIAADAAKAGAESTKDMQARFGRAKNIGEKSIGEQDPGATSVSFIFKGFHEGVTNIG